ncbi:MAG: hypothetical protein II794_00050, partial [Oscillospiraceae bacterium]|nr:hypothetical protein [Oscillospiraceae bacterium]
IIQEDGTGYRQAMEKWRGKDLNEIIEGVKSEQRGYFSTFDIGAQAKHVRDYEAYLKNVKKQAEQMSRSSIFGKDKNSFVYKNIQKTAADYEAMQGIQVSFGSDLAVTDWLSFRGGDIFFVIGLILVVLSFFDDRRRGLHALIRGTPKGRVHLALSRLGVLLLSSVVLTLLMYGIPLMAAFFVYGGVEDLGRSAQSMEIFKTCTWHVTIAQWLELYFGIKVLCGLVIGLIFWFVLSFLSQMQLAWLVILGILGVEYAAYAFIAPQMAISIFRYVNIFSYIFSEDILASYVNMNFFGTPFSALTLLSWLMGILLVTLSVGTVLAQVCRYPYGNRDILGGIVKLWNRAADVVRSRLPILAMEGYKLLILAGAVIFLAVGMYMGTRLGYKGYEYSVNMDYVYQQYMNEAKGPVGEETDGYLARAQEQLDLRPMSARDFQGSLTKLTKEVQRLRDAAAERGYEPWLLDQVNINNYIGDKTWPRHTWNAMAAMVFVIVAAAPVFSFESQAGTLYMIRTTSRGRRSVFRKKYVILLIETLLIWGAVYGRELWGTVENLGLEQMAAPVWNVQLLAEFPWNIPLGAFFAIEAVIRLAGLYTTALITARFSMLTSRWEQAALVTAAVLILPGALYYFDQGWAAYISMVPFVSGVQVLSGFTGKEALSYLSLAWIALGLFLTWRNRHHWIKGR